MLKNVVLLMLLSTQTALAKYKVCKETTDGKLSNITYFDEQGKKFMSVKIYDLSPSLKDTTVYIYDNHLLVKQYTYFTKQQIALKPVDEILAYMRNNPDAINQPLLPVMKKAICDTDMTVFFYNDQKQLIREERSTFTDTLTKDSLQYLGEFTEDDFSRTWVNIRFTDYKYDSKGRLIEMSGTLEDHPFGRPLSNYINSVKKVFYDSSGRIKGDSIISYNGKVFDGAISTYSYGSNGYTIFYESHGRNRISREKFVFVLDKSGQVLSETSYRLDENDPAPAGIDDFSRKNTYEYNTDNSLHQKTTYYFGGNSTSQTIYTYE